MKWMLLGATLAAGYSANSWNHLKQIEREKAQDAKALVGRIADANRTIGEGGNFATGMLGPGHRLNAYAGLQDVNWQAQPYEFYAADDLGSCIVARATRKAADADGTTHSKYAKLGFCANKKGDVEALDADGNCNLQCLSDSLGAMPAVPVFGQSAAQ